MAKGGVSGEVKFPAYIETFHEDLMGSAPLATVGDLMDIAISANPYDYLVTSPENALTEVETKFDAYEAILQGMAAQTDWEAFIDAVKTKFAAKSYLEAYVSSTARTDISTAHTTLDTNAKAAIAHGVAEKTDWAGLVTQALTSVDTAGYLSEIPIYGIVAAAESGSSEQIAEAVRAALAAVDSTVMQSLYNAYASRLETQRAKALRSVGATMSGINAVNGSSFLFATALVEAEHQARLSEYQAQTEGALLTKGIESWMQVFSAQLSARVEAAVHDQASRDQHLLQGIAQMAQILGFRLDYEIKYLAQYGSTFLEYLRQELQFAANKAHSLDQMMLDSTKTLGIMDQYITSETRAATNLFGDIQRVRIVATQEYESKDMDTDARNAMWDLDMYHRGANILGAPAGMGSPFPEKPGAAAGALGGALTGGAAGVSAVAGLAAAGVATGGLALPIIAGAAALGGIGGLLQ